MKSKLFAFMKIVFVVTGMGCAASVIWAGYHYLNTDPRFNVRQISVLGLKHVAEDDVMGRIKLNTQSNTNFFAVNMDDVRDHVEQIPWVRYAVVQRVLPDEIVITIVEREEVGLARIDGQISAFDNEAAILQPDDSATTKFPILIGMRANDTEGNLKKIEMYSRTMKELSGAGLSEIIVNQNNEVSVVRDKDPVVVNLGVTDFQERWSNYMKLKSRISTEYKDAVRVDLRFRNKIIVSMQDDDDGGKVIWDGKKKSL
jgi:cell division septal protein FtsQ